MKLTVKRHSKGTIVSLQCKDVVATRILIDIILLVVGVYLEMYLS